MNITTKFGLFDRVRITELEQSGVVLCFFVDSGGMQIKVRYFHNGESKEVYFLESELEPIGAV